MNTLFENWFFILVLLGCVGMHFFHGHGSGGGHGGHGPGGHPSTGAEPQGRQMDEER